MMGLPALSAFSATRRNVSAALDVLEQQQQRVGLALVEDEVGEVERLQARLVAGGDDVAERQLLGAPVVEEGKAHAAALGDTRPAVGAGALPAPAASSLASMAGLKVGQRLLADVGEALRVGAHHRHVVALGDGADLVLHARAALVPRRFGKAAAQHHGRAHAGLAAALQFLRHVLGRDDDDGEIGGLRQVGDAGVGLQAQHLGAAAADGIELSGEGVAPHHVEDAPAQALRIGRGADQRHRARPEQGAEIRH